MQRRNHCSNISGQVQDQCTAALVCRGCTGLAMQVHTACRLPSSDGHSTWKEPSSPYRDITADTFMSMWSQKTLTAGLGGCAVKSSATVQAIAWHNKHPPNTTQSSHTQKTSPSSICMHAFCFDAPQHHSRQSSLQVAAPTLIVHTHKQDKSKAPHA